MDTWRTIENMIEASGYLHVVSATKDNIFISSHPKCDDAVRKIRSRRSRAIIKFEYACNRSIIFESEELS